jgi:two-component system, chemotaxis family, protein-glutamate methylesterase/glutaminase
MNSTQRCIVIGASAGGLEAVKDLVAQFPRDLPAPVFLVMHIPPHSPSLLPDIVGKAGPLPAGHPQDGAKVKAGYIYIAPPDHHLLIDDSHVAVKRGPKENRFRPSIDALFRSAAYSYGPAAIGVVLSGLLDDGTSGLWSIKRFGGIAIVQDPYQARYPSMPRSALEHVEADYQLPAKEIGALLGRLVYERPTRHVLVGNDREHDIESRIAKEVQIAAGMGTSQQSILELGTITPFTCPECHGNLIRIAEGKLRRYRCHTGHGFTEDALLEGVMESVGDMIWQVTRGLQEAEMLLEHMGQHLQNAGDSDKAEIFFAKAHEIQKQASKFQELAVDHESLSAENLDQH